MKIAITALACAAIFTACTKDNSGSGAGLATMEMAISHQASGKAMVLNGDVNTPNGEQIRYTVFKYYISNLTLLNDRGEAQPSAAAYFLIDESDGNSKILPFNIPEGNYSAIRFLLGVDSARNVSGVQEGALDPAKGMFWTWNTGYIMAKMEGKSINSPAPLQNVTYHVGGFKQSNSVLKTITLSFGRNVTVKANQQLALQVKGDADKWWTGAHTIRIANLPVVMEAGADAMKLADNYANMFTLQAVEVK